MFINVLMNISALAVEYTQEEINNLMWQMPLLGMLMIFAVLGLLWAVLSVFKLIFVGKTEKAPKAPKAPKEKKPVQEPKKSASAAQPDSAELMAVLSAAVAAHQNNDEIIAVITAAVAAQRAAEGETGGFRVVSFKRASSRAWNVK